MGYSMKSGPDLGSILHDSSLGALYPVHFGITLKPGKASKFVVDKIILAFKLEKVIFKLIWNPWSWIPNGSPDEPIMMFLWLTKIPAFVVNWVLQPKWVENSVLCLVIHILEYKVPTTFWDKSFLSYRMLSIWQQWTSGNLLPQLKGLITNE